MNKAEKKHTIIVVYGNNNRVSLNETRAHFPAIAVNTTICVLLIAVAILTVFFCCPDRFPDFVRFIIGKVIDN